MRLRSAARLLTAFAYPLGPNHATFFRMLTTIPYLARDPIFDKERAFDTDYLERNVGEIRKTNHVFDNQEVTVHDVGSFQGWDLNVHGFCVIKAKTTLSPDDAFNRKKDVQKAYWYEIEAILHERFPEYSRIECYDLTVP
jgi:hypothetical protein